MSATINNSNTIDLDSWPIYEDSDDVVWKLSNATKRKQDINFGVTPNLTFIMTRCGEEQEFAQVAKAIKAAPISKVTFFGGSHDEPSLNYQKYQDLCQVLGSIPTIHKATFEFPDIQGRDLTMAIQSMGGRPDRRLRVDIRVPPRNQEAAVDLALLEANVHQMAMDLQAAVFAGSDLPIMIHETATALYRNLLPGLATVTHATSLFLLGGGLSDQEMKPEDARAIANVIRNASPRLDMNLLELNFSGDEASQVLCDGIAESRMDKICFFNCRVDAAQLGTALAICRIKSIQLLRMENVMLATLPLLLTNLGNGLQSPCLEHFELNWNRPHVHMDNVMMTGMAALVRGAGNCKNLKKMQLPCMEPAEMVSLDPALEICVLGATQLEHLTLHCHGKPPQETAVALPCLIEAMKSNYAIKTLELQSAVSERVAANYPWSNDTKRQLAMIVRMNRLGRDYLGRDPSNRLAGTELLAQVTDDLNCLHYHLCENPNIVKEPSQAGQPDKKRKMV